MRHSVDGRQFGRHTPHRKAMLKNLANAVLQQEQIITTIEKAKETRRVVDRLITLGKAGTDHARRLAFSRTRDKAIVTKLFDELKNRYASRNGGYTRLLKLSDTRRGDGANMAVLELVDHPKIDRKRVKPEVDENASQQEAAVQNQDADQQMAADPFKKMRKAFGQIKKKKKSAPKKEAKKK